MLAHPQMMRLSKKALALIVSRTQPSGFFYVCKAGDDAKADPPWLVITAEDAPNRIKKHAKDIKDKIGREGSCGRVYFDDKSKKIVFALEKTVGPMRSEDMSPVSVKGALKEASKHGGLSLLKKARVVRGDQADLGLPGPDEDPDGVDPAGEAMEIGEMLALFADVGVPEESARRLVRRRFSTAAQLQQLADLQLGDLRPQAPDAADAALGDDALLAGLGDDALLGGADDAEPLWDAEIMDTMMRGDDMEFFRSRVLTAEQKREREQWKREHLAALRQDAAFIDMGVDERPLDVDISELGEGGRGTAYRIRRGDRDYVVKRTHKETHDLARLLATDLAELEEMKAALQAEHNDFTYLANQALSKADNQTFARVVQEARLLPKRFAAYHDAIVALHRAKDEPSYRNALDAVARRDEEIEESLSVIDDGVSDLALPEKDIAVFLRRCFPQYPDAREFSRSFRDGDRRTQQRQQIREIASKGRVKVEKLLAAKVKDFLLSGKVKENIRVGQAAASFSASLLDVDLRLERLNKTISGWDEAFLGRAVDNADAVNALDDRMQRDAAHLAYIQAYRKEFEVNDRYLAAPQALKVGSISKLMSRLPETAHALGMDSTMREHQGYRRLRNMDFILNFAYDEQEDTLAIEHVKGKDGYDFLKALYTGEVSPSPEERKAIFNHLYGELTRILFTMKDAGVYPTDFKPENLMLAEDGSVKLIDLEGLIDIRQTPSGKFHPLQGVHTPGFHYHKPVDPSSCAAALRYTLALNLVGIMGTRQPALNYTLAAMAYKNLNARVVQLQPSLQAAIVASCEKIQRGEVFVGGDRKKGLVRFPSYVRRGNQIVPAPKKQWFTVPQLEQAIHDKHGNLSLGLDPGQQGGAIAKDAADAVIMAFPTDTDPAVLTMVRGLLLGQGVIPEQDHEGKATLARLMEPAPEEPPLPFDDLDGAALGDMGDDFDGAALGDMNDDMQRGQRAASSQGAAPVVDDGDGGLPAIEEEDDDVEDAFADAMDDDALLMMDMDAMVDAPPEDDASPPLGRGQSNQL